jgi:hypothetical protein
MPDSARACQTRIARPAAAGRIRALPLERGCVPQSGTSRSGFARLACRNTPDAAELFNVLRLVLCTQPRSSLVAFGGSARMRPRSMTPGYFNLTGKLNTYE